jgi:hypothetical protein
MHATNTTALADKVAATKFLYGVGCDVWLQERERFALAVLHLVHRALARFFVHAPAKKLRAVPESPASKMIIGNFHDYFRSNRFPFTRAVRAPTARSSWSAASKSRWSF